MIPIVKACRDVVQEREGDFLTMIIGNPALYMIPNSDTASVLVDALARSEPQLFIEKVGMYLHDCVEVGASVA